MGEGPRDSAGANDPEMAASAHADALRRAVQAVEASERGRPVHQIETALIRELRARRSYLPPEEIHLTALDISDPTWALRHPFRLRRLMQETRKAAEARESVVADDNDRTMARLQEALDSLPRLRRSSISAHRTMDGWEYAISIDRWSATCARKLERIAAPALVTVRPFEANGQAPRSAT
jgi:hypothetical protein